MFTSNVFLPPPKTCLKSSATPQIPMKLMVLYDTNCLRHTIYILQTSANLHKFFQGLSLFLNLESPKFLYFFVFSYFTFFCNFPFSNEWEHWFLPKKLQIKNIWPKTVPKSIKFLLKPKKKEMYFKKFKHFFKEKSRKSNLRNKNFTFYSKISQKILLFLGGFRFTKAFRSS